MYFLSLPEPLILTSFFSSLSLSYLFLYCAGPGQGEGDLHHGGLWGGACGLPSGGCAGLPLRRAHGASVRSLPSGWHRGGLRQARVSSGHVWMPAGAHGRRPPVSRATRSGEQGSGRTASRGGLWRAGHATICGRARRRACGVTASGEHGAGSGGRARRPPTRVNFFCDSF
jgi:hypothetical protein